MPKLNIQGHRGSRGLRPESTLPAFEVALDLMVTTLELDLHLTADDEVVIWHDEELWDQKCRIIDGAPDHLDLPAPVRSVTVDDLAYFACDRNPEPERFDAQICEPTELAGDAFRVVRLADLFNFVTAYASAPEKSDAQRLAAERVEFNIETKRVPNHPEYIGDDFDGENVGTFERVLIDVIDSAGMAERSTIQSFDFRSLRAIHKVRPGLKLSALTEFAPDFDEISSTGASIWSPYYAPLTEGQIAEAHRRGLEVLPWTVNTVEEMRQLIELGVDGFITDRPDLGMRFA
ncbi:MAG: glycerophosphodiester phosphodiesterase family protein [Acidimicrobiales bacterium]